MNDLEKARQTINEVDKQMAELFCKRMDAARLVAEYKKERGLPILDEARENAVVENAGGKFMLYTKDGANEIKMEKKELAGEVYKGGNVSDLGGYYNELVYFCEKAKNGEQVEKATLCAGVSSLEFLLKELAFNA